MLIVTLHSALPAGDAAPEWIHLVPAGEFSGADGRGPYRVRDAAAVIRHSMQAGTGRLPIDVNHAIDLKAPKGEEAPARGWIVELQERGDGIWGRVEWTEAGRAMVAGKEYRGISPAITRKADGEITGVLRASLTNTPNLTQLATLHNRIPDMDFIARVRQALGLGADVPEADVLTALSAQKTAVDTHASQLAAIRTAAGLAATVSADAIVTELQARQSTGEQQSAQLRATVVDLQTRLSTLQEEGARDKATRYIDDAIKAGRAGLVPIRDHMIERHMKDSAAVEKEVAAYPLLNGGRVVTPPRADPNNPSAGLTSEEIALCSQMGLTHEQFAASKKQLGTEAL